MSDQYDFFATPRAASPDATPAVPPPTAPPQPSAPGYGTPAPAVGVPVTGYGAPAPGYGPPGLGGYPPQGPGGYPAAPYGRPFARPGQVTAVAVLTFVGAGFAVLGAVAVFVLASLLGNAFDAEPAVSGVVVVIAVVLLAFAGLDVLIGVGLLKGAYWALIVSTVLNGLGLAGAFVNLVQGEATSAIISGAISGLILYLLWNPQSKAWFDARR